jgi:hypothetical protein
LTTIAHELVVHHVNGNVGRVVRPGFSTLLVKKQAARIMEKRSDIAAIEISTIDLDKCVSYVETLRKPRAFNVSWRKVGGLTFVRVGRLSLSFCLTRKGL